MSFASRRISREIRRGRVLIRRRRRFVGDYSIDARARHFAAIVVEREIALRSDDDDDEDAVLRAHARSWGYLTRTWIISRFERPRNRDARHRHRRPGSRARVNAHPTTRRCARSASHGETGKTRRRYFYYYYYSCPRPRSTVVARSPHHQHHHHTRRRRPTAMAIAGASMGKNPSRGRRTRGRIIAAPRLIAQRGRKWRHRCVE